MDDNVLIWKIIKWSVGGLLALIILGMVGCPQYNVYSQRLSGEAKLEEARSSRQITIEEAKAKEQSAKSLASAEVTRATGAANANKILQDSLGGPSGYLRYLQIQALQDTNAKMIYVPTESGLPITEASRLAPTPAE